MAAEFVYPYGDFVAVGCGYCVLSVRAAGECCVGGGFGEVGEDVEEVGELV